MNELELKKKIFASLLGFMITTIASSAIFFVMSFYDKPFSFVWLFVWIFGPAIFFWLFVRNIRKLASESPKQEKK